MLTGNSLGLGRFQVGGRFSAGSPDAFKTRGGYSLETPLLQARVQLSVQTYSTDDG